jgi:hypothetical protein
MVNIDPYLDIARKQVHGFHAAYVHATSDADTTGFAHIYGCPLFSYGVALTNFNRVRVYCDDFIHHTPHSRLGTTLALYAGFERKVLTACRGRLQLSYMLRNGLGVSSHTWNRSSNDENELIGSRFSIYFGAGIHLAYQTGNWRFKLTEDFDHFSNGALSRPNKGANFCTTGLSATCFLRDAPPLQSRQARVRLSDSDRGFLLDLTYHMGLKTSIGEWLVDREREKEGRPLKYGHYDLYLSHNVSAALLYRYDLRYASGIGLDLFYEPYVNQIELQNSMPHGHIPRCCFGVAACHQAGYKRMTVRMSAGAYIGRRFGRYANTDEEYGYYERIGLSYTPPTKHDRLYIGYDVLAHRTKAYATEVTLGWKLPLGRRKAEAR